MTSRLTAGARWWFLSIAAIAAAASLFVTGYSHRLVGASATILGSDKQALPTGSGPVLNLSGSVPSSKRLPSKTIALTFDDGPDPRWTPAVLDVLEREHVPATFFVVGSRVLDNPALVRREIADGNAVGAHTYTHLDLTSHSAAQGRLELSLTQKALAAAISKTTELVRPPYSSTVDGATPEDVKAWKATTHGYEVVLADKDSEDWQRPGVQKIIANATPDGNAGTIAMFHDGGGFRGETVAALTKYIDVLKAKGWRFVTVPQGVGLANGGLADATLNVSAQGTALLVAEQSSLWVARLLGVLLLGVAGLSVLRALLMVFVAHRHAKQAAVSEETLSDSAVHALPVTVIVPAYNEEAGIEATIRSLLASDHGNVEIIVVDDGSTDSTSKITHQFVITHPQVRLITQPNAGKAHALNAGIAAANGEFIVLVDGDTVIEPNTLTEIVRPFSDPGVGGVAGNTKVGNRGRLLGRWQHIEYVVGFNLDRRFFDMTNCMQTIPGAIGAFRRGVLHATGGVPTDTLAEDTDLTIAVGLAGWRVAYQGSARAWTEAPETFQALWRQRYRWAYGTMQAAWKHRRDLGAKAVTGPGGATTNLGRVGLPYLLMFGILLPLLAPLVDLFALVGLVFTNPWQTAAAWGVFGGIQFLLAGYALHLDGERKRVLWVLPLQQIVYRQLMYLVVVEATLAAVTGRRLRWHKLARTGSAAVALEASRQTVAHQAA